MAAARLGDEILRREKAMFMVADQAAAEGGAAFDGKLGKQEVQALFAKQGWDLARAEQVLGRLDLDGDGQIGFNEWVAATMDLNPVTSREAALQVRALFDELDSDGDGVIRLDELRAHFGELPASHEAALASFFASLDKDGDGSIERAEFMAWWRWMAS
eukprot:610643-Prymnesium_polylepis.1